MIWDGTGKGNNCLIDLFLDFGEALTSFKFKNSVLLMWKMFPNMFYFLFLPKLCLWEYEQMENANKTQPQCVLLGIKA